MWKNYLVRSTHSHVHTTHFNCHHFIRRVAQIISVFNSFSLSFSLFRCFLLLLLHRSMFFSVDTLTRCCLIFTFGVYFFFVWFWIVFAVPLLFLHVYSFSISIWIISLGLCGVFFVHSGVSLFVCVCSTY